MQQLFSRTFSMTKFTLKALLITTFLLITSCCDTDSIPSKTNTLYSSSAKERNKAALDLARCGSRAGGAVPKLAELLYDENVGVQSSAAYALRQIDTPNARAVLERAENARRKRSQ